MPTTDPRVDAVLIRVTPPVREMLVEIRKRVHAAVPQVTETIKWGMPFFTFEGKILAMMAGFKQHIRYGIWVAGDRPPESNVNAYSTLADLPPAKEMATRLKLAAEKIKGGADTIMGRRARQRRPVIKPPPEFTRALSGHARARAAWAKLTPGVKRDYVEWVAGAKQAATRHKRIAEAIKLIAVGKGRLWKYQRKAA